MERLKYMKCLIQGTDVQLINKIPGPVDGFNRPTDIDSDPITVENVLVGEPSSDDVINALNLDGKRIKYTLAIPKGDNHKWEGDVIIWGDRYHIYTTPTQGIEDNIPLLWNKKVLVEDYRDYNNEES